MGVGVYRDANGVTPVMKAVKEAEKILLETQESKRYLGPEGDMAYVSLLKPYIFGASVDLWRPLDGPANARRHRRVAPRRRTRACRKSVSGSLARHALLAQSRPDIQGRACRIQAYRFVDLAAQKVDFDSVRHALGAAKAGDVVLLHGCCHNPTGMGFSPR